MKRINYKSDFDFILRLRDCRGEEIGWPDYDWEAKLWTSTKANCFIAGCTNGVVKNCYNDGEKIHIVADNHHLGRGVLHVEFTAKLPNDLYPDADERIVVPVDLDIQLISTAAPCPESFEVELMLPYVKISWKDLTPEQIAELKQPAVDAANETREVIEEARTATTEAIRATEDAVEATRNANSATEEARTAASEASTTNKAMKEAEAVRVATETQRVKSEQTRVDNEAIRVSAEERRATAETERANAESTRISDESARKDAETTRVANEETRKTRETARAGAEAERAKAEALRVSAENDRKEAEKLRVSAERKRATEFAGFKEVIDAKQEKLGTSEGLTIEDGVLSLTERAKQMLFDDMFKAAAGIFGTVDHTHVEDGVKKPYYLNELWLTYEEAVNVLNHKSYLRTGSFKRLDIRTNLADNFNMADGADGVSCSYMFAWCSRLETARPPMIINNTAYIFYQCSNLREVLGNLSVYSKGITNGFYACFKLEEIRLSMVVGGDLNLRDCPRLSLASFEYLINNTTKQFTVTVHPDVYTKLMDETNTEWHQLLLDAAEKQIQFATK